MATPFPRLPIPAPEVEDPAVSTHRIDMATAPFDVAWISSASPAEKLKECVVSLHVIAGSVTVHVTPWLIPFLRHVKVTAVPLPIACTPAFTPNPEMVPALP